MRHEQSQYFNPSFNALTVTARFTRIALRIGVGVVVSVLSLCLMPLSYAESEAARALTLKLQNIQDMKADFVQKVISDKGQLVQETKGKIWVKKPQKFRWEVAEPYAQVIVTDSELVWLYDKDLEQAVVRKLGTEISSVPALLISGDAKDLEKSYKIHTSKDVKGHVTYVLSPRADDALFGELQASFDGERLATMRLVDNLGQYTNIRFINSQNNKGIADSVFSLQLPPSVDVIREDRTQAVDSAVDAVVNGDVPRASAVSVDGELTKPNAAAQTKQDTEINSVNNNNHSHVTEDELSAVKAQALKTLNTELQKKMDALE